MTAVLSLVGVVLVALGWDWLGVTRLAAYYSDFDYRYWPLSRRRQVGLGALILTAVYFWALTGSNAPLWLLIPAAILFGIWAVTALNDLNAQRRTGYRTPPTYSEGDY